MNVEKLLRARGRLSQLERYWINRAEYWAKVSGFGGLHCSCEYYVEKILQAQRRARHYGALQKLSCVALARIAPAHRKILYRRYFLNMDVATLVEEEGANERAVWRKIERAMKAYEREINRLLALRSPKKRSYS